MKKAILLAVPLLALGSCGRASEQAADAVGGAPAQGAYSQSPGEYETTFRIVSVSLEGFPAEAQEQVRRAQEQPQTQRACSPIGFSLDSMNLRNMRFTIPGNRGGCNIGEITTEGGRMSMALSCEINNLPQGRDPNAPRNIALSASFNGTYAPDTFSATGRAEMNVPGDDSRRGSIEIEVSSRRVGDCPPGSDPFSPGPRQGAPIAVPPPLPTGNMSDSGSAI